MVTLVIRRSATDTTILGTNGMDAIVKGLRLLHLVGTVEQVKEAANLLQQLGEPIFERPS